MIRQRLSLSAAVVDKIESLVQVVRERKGREREREEFLGFVIYELFSSA